MLAWRQAEVAPHTARQVAEECLGRAGDLSGLLLLHTAKGSAAGLQQLLQLAGAQKRQNIAFLCQLLLGNLGACVDLLIEAGRIPEAAFFARTYLPSRMSEVGAARLAGGFHAAGVLHAHGCVTIPPAVRLFDLQPMPAQLRWHAGC